MGGGTIVMPYSEATQYEREPRRIGATYHAASEASSTGGLMPKPGTRTLSPKP